MVKALALKAEQDKREAAEAWPKPQGPTYSAQQTPNPGRPLQRTPRIPEPKLKIPEEGYLQVKTMLLF